MKKTLIIMAIAVALIFAFAATAMARPSGNLYISWDPTTGGNAASVASPHTDYQTATEKCNVCHSVHYAATAGAVWADAANAGNNAWTADAASANTQMLLRSNVAGACNYCHITTSIGGVQLYGGVVTNYTTASGFNHYGGPAACSGCHAVHGANTFQGANTAKVLRVRSDRPTQPDVLANGVGRNADITALFADLPTAVASGNKYEQQVAFCTQCHWEYTTASEATITASGNSGVYYDGGYTTTPYKGHPLKTADAVFSAAGANTSLQVAYAGSTTCRSCHDAGGVNESGVTSNSFPHYTTGYYVFSTWGDSVGDVTAADPTREFATDGNCLKCHVNAALTSGVNITY